MANEVDAVVIGAGVIGLAIARSLARRGWETLVLDAESSYGTATSARNSEVIHAGIYYPAGSMKARLCVSGRDLLYRYCAERQVPHRRIGKLIFAASPDQFAQLDAITASAAAAGVNDLVMLDRADVRRIEPELDCAGALWSPATGIIDSHAYMTALLGDIEAARGQFVGRARVTRLSRQRTGWGVHIGGENAPTVTARRVVNAAGLTAHHLAAATDDMPASFRPAVRYARGVYFGYAGRVPFTHLIYPVPVPGGLGTHLTLDLAGRARFGPDVEWIDGIDYHVDPARHAQFARAAALIWDGIRPELIVPDYAGIRPKLSGPGEPAADFLIAGPSDHQLDGMVALFGMESPGLTASLAIGEHVTNLLAAGAGQAATPSGTGKCSVAAVAE